jgi:ATP-dependent Clp protease ATP-binding subunit ClpC
MNSTPLPQTPRYKKATKLADKVASECRTGYVGVEHLLAGILREGEGPVCSFLQQKGVTLDSLDHLLRRRVVDTSADVPESVKKEWAEYLRLKQKFEIV